MIQDSLDLERIIKRGDLVALKEKLLSDSTTDSILDSGYFWHALNVACELAKVEALKFFVENGYSSGDLLLYACSKYNIKAVMALVEQCNADVNCQDGLSGFTPLMEAIRNLDFGDMDILMYLLQHGADIFATDPDGRSVLQMTVIYIYYCPKMTEAVKMMIKHCPSDRIKKCVNMPDKLGRTPLMEVVWSTCNYALAEYLIECGADVNATDKCRQTALGYAARDDDKLEFAKLLIVKGAKIDGGFGSDWTPLMTASVHNLLCTVQLLIENGASLNRTDRYGETALMKACKAGHVDMVRELVDNDAKVNIKDCYGQTALMKALPAKNYREIIDILVANGAHTDKLFEKTDYLRRVVLLQRRELDHPSKKTKT